jgi:SAM-dependent methyltransferase
MTDVAGAKDFAGSGDSYDRFMGRYSQLLAPLFADFCTVEEGQRLLDVGCGPGAFTAVALDRLGPGAVVAVDPSPSFVAACRERHPDVDVRQGAAEALPVEDAGFDRAVAQLVLHFVSDPPRSVAEMRRAVRPGGLVGVCVWHGGEEMGLIHAVSQSRAAVEPPHDEPEPRAFGGEGELAALLAAAGLAAVEEAVLSVTVRYAGFDELWSSLLEGIGPAGSFVVALDDEARERYREELFSRVGRPAGDFTLSATARAARGVVPAG